MTRATKPAPTPRKRPLVHYSLDPDEIDAAKQMAEADGLPVARWIGQLIREERGRRERRERRR